MAQLEEAFLGQKLTVTLTCKDAAGDIIDLSARTVHFYYRDPDGNETIDTSPTIADPTNGEVAHTYPATTGLDALGIWQDKVYIDVDEIPSTRHRFRVINKWDA